MVSIAAGLSSSVIRQSLTVLLCHVFPGLLCISLITFGFRKSLSGDVAGRLPEGVASPVTFSSLDL